MNAASRDVIFYGGSTEHGVSEEKGKHIRRKLDSNHHRNHFLKALLFINRDGRGLPIFFVFTYLFLSQNLNNRQKKTVNCYTTLRILKDNQGSTPCLTPSKTLSINLCKFNPIPKGITTVKCSTSDWGSASRT